MYSTIALHSLSMLLAGAATTFLSLSHRRVTYKMKEWVTFSCLFQVF